MNNTSNNKNSSHQQLDQSIKPHFDLIIANATCLIASDLPTGSSSSFFVHQNYEIKQHQVDIGIRDGKISAIGSLAKNDCTDFFDAKGLHCLPGVIDSQVHFREPGMTQKEDLETGTRAALLGGVTAIFEMPNTIPATTTKELLFDKIKRAKGRAHTHFAFYVGASYDNIAELAELENIQGCSGVKIFMGSSTGTLLVEDDDKLEQILRSGKRRVIVHSEDEYRLRERKHIATDSHDVRNHHVWRDTDSALLSTKRLIRLCKKTSRPVHVLHISTGEEMDFLREEKKHCNATVEVLPQHLTLFAPDCYERLGTLAQQNPPIREKHHLEALWRALSDGTVDVIGSDHAPHTLEEKQKQYPQSPSGVPGVQTLLPIMLDHVHNKRLSLERLTELVCEKPRHVFSVKQKGRIAVGMDADFTLVDLKKQKTIENKWIASRCGWTPFDGMKVTGWPMAVILKGQVAMNNDEILLPHQGEMVLHE